MFSRKFKPFPRIFSGLFVPVLLLPTGAIPAPIDLAKAPLYTTTTGSVKPNLMFILDDSGSMASWMMPDDAPDENDGKYGYYSTQCNGLAFDPAITYTPPVKADGSSYPDRSFTSTCDNAITTGSCSGRNLTGAYYYAYTGSQPKLDYTGSTSTDFYKECHSAIGNTPGSSVFTKVTVSAAQQQNYANWYSYYRTRMLMMKTAVGQAFKNMNANFRIGFTAISYTGATDGALHLSINDFDSTQKSNFYSKLYGTNPNSYTPLRGALSKVGRIFAGKLGTDPMQYSCQQNFALLSTDGYWNNNIETSSYGPYKIDGSTGVGQQDGSAVRPMYDGYSSTTTAKTPTTTVTRQQTDTDKTTTTTYTRHTYWYGAYGADGCSATRHKRYDQTEKSVRTVVQRTTKVDDVSSVTTRTVVTTNGVVTSDTTSAPVNTTTNVTPNTMSTVSDVTTAWAAVGAPTTGSCTTSTTLPSPNPSSPTNSSTNSTAPAVVTVVSTTGPTVGTTTTTTTTSGGSSNSLADVAMYYYETDLRNASLGNCTSGTTGADVCEDNVPGTSTDNNKQQHMTTFTLGLGMSGVLKYSPSYLTDNSGDFYQIKTGTKNWPDPINNGGRERIDDLWHAAVNGRGVYFSASNPTTLVSSLNAALAGMSARIGYGTAAATSNLEPTAGDNALYVASFTTAKWIGNVQANSIDPGTGAVNNNATWCVEDVEANTSAGIAACTGKMRNQVDKSTDTRHIYFRSTGGLADFKYSNLDTTKKTWFDPSKLSQWSSTLTASDKALATGASLIDYLRGQTQYESQSGSVANLYRDRDSTLGDIVESQPVFMRKPVNGYVDPGYPAFVAAKASRAGTVFVGANDGMLHAFDAAEGSERWAYVPAPVMPNMYWLADNTYTPNHRFFVNGRTTVADLCTSNCSSAASATWRTILVGGLGGGGRGFYALDVTDPTAPTSLWEFTSLDDPDLGYSFGNPVVIKRGDGKWVVLLTSGYDNVKLSDGSPYDANGSGRGYLYVLDPVTGAVLKKIDTGVGSASTPSGLSRIAVWSENPSTDVTAVTVYGGDLLGNVWRFNIDTGAVSKLTTLTDGSTAQPITTKPELANVYGKKVVYVATGKYLEASDLTNTQVQSIYAIKDDGSTVASPRTTLVKQTLTDAGSKRTVTSNTVDFATQGGWYIDLPDTGERSNVNMVLAMGTLIVPTNVPTNGVCAAGGYSWLNYFNYKTGSYVAGANEVGTWMGNDMTTGINMVLINGQWKVIRTGSGSAPGLANVKINPSGTTGVKGNRVSWREIYKK